MGRCTRRRRLASVTTANIRRTRGAAHTCTARAGRYATWYSGMNIRLSMLDDECTSMCGV